MGIAAAEGLLGLTDPLLSHLGHLVPAASEGVELITIEQLLTMTSGIVYRWDDTTTSPAADPARPIVAAPLGSVPGTTFAYRGSNTYLLSRIIHACSGQDVRDFLQVRLLAPLGIKDPPWQRCPLGFSSGATGLSLRTQEVAHLGLTLLNQGSWQGHQLIPADYTVSLTSDRPTSGSSVSPAAPFSRSACAREGLTSKRSALPNRLPRASRGTRCTSWTS